MWIEDEGPSLLISNGPRQDKTVPSTAVFAFASIASSGLGTPVQQTLCKLVRSADGMTDTSNPLPIGASVSPVSNQTGQFISVSRHLLSSAFQGNKGYNANIFLTYYQVFEHLAYVT